MTSFVYYARISRMYFGYWGKAVRKRLVHELLDIHALYGVPGVELLLP